MFWYIREKIVNKAICDNVNLICKSTPKLQRELKLSSTCWNKYNPRTKVQLMRNNFPIGVISSFNSFDRLYTIILEKSRRGQVFKQKHRFVVKAKESEIKVL